MASLGLYPFIFDNAPEIRLGETPPSFAFAINAAASLLVRTCSGSISDRIRHNGESRH